MFNFLIMCVYSVYTSLELLHDVLPYVHAEEFVSL